MLKGKAAIVTGSTSGIGLGVARALAGAGADVMLNGFGNAGAIEQLRAELSQELGVRVAYSGADMSKAEQIGAMVQQAQSEFGRLNILVNNGNAICLGWVLTALVQKQIDSRSENEGITADKAKFELLSEKQPSHEFVTPEQLGASAVFLCSDAAAQIRGQALAMDGGWTAQ